MVQSLRSRLRLLLLLVAAPGIAFILFQGVAERTSIVKLNEARSERIVARLAAVQKMQIDETRVYLEALAASAPVQDASLPACSDFLSFLLPLAGNYRHLAVARSDGVVSCSAVATGRAANISDKGFFRKALQTRRFAMGNLDGDPFTGDAVVGFAAPVFDDDGSEGDVVGVAVATVAAERWARELAPLLLPGDVAAFFTDTDSRIIAASPDNPDLRGRPISAIGLTDTPQSIAASVAIVGADGIRRMFSGREVHAANGDSLGRVYVGLPIDTAFRDLRRRSLARYLLLSTVLVVAWWIASRLAISKISRPLDALSASIDVIDSESAVAGNEQTTRDDAVSNVSELRTLGQRIRGLAGARHAAERAEQNRREEMAALLEALPDFYFRIDRGGVILDWHGRDDSNLVLAPERFKGRPMSELVPQDVYRLFDENMKRQRATGEVVTWEYPMEIAGDQRFFEARACPVSDREETVLVIRDITGRKRTEDFLRTAALVYEASSEGMIVTDASGRIEIVNPAVARDTGHAQADLVGRPVAELVAEEDRARLRAGIDGGDHKPSGASWTGEVMLERASGGAYPAWVTLNPIISEAGEVRQWIFLSRDMTEIRAANDEIHRQAELDALTGLANRRGLTSALAAVCNRAARRGEPLALLFVDVDRLKQVNDRLGHRAGDAVLVEVAGRLRGCVREGDFVARQAGDEFIVILPGPDAVARSKEVADQILTEIARPFLIGEETARLSASLGVAVYPLDADDPHLLLVAADQAMFEAKSSGRNRARRFSPQIRQSASDRIRLLDELHKGLDGGQFDLQYQPIIDLASGRVAKVEALLRWQHPEFGPISPVRFIPLAETSRLIRPLGDWTLKRASADLPKLIGRFGEGFQISLNLSPAHVTADPVHDDLDWADYIGSSGIARGGFVIEVTEGALLEPDSEVARRLAALREAGALVALDDFGTGYSSLLYFLRYDFDFLKIDQEFVRGVARSEKAAVLCETMLRLSRGLGCQVIAEGIETHEQCAVLRDFGCEFGQGYHFSRPLGMDDLLRLPVTLDPS